MHSIYSITDNYKLAIKHNKLRTGIILLGLIEFLTGGCKRFSGSNQNSVNERPNILIIMADDMGFSDLGCYGGEINTPNIDALAENGIRYRQFYNSGRCCPTRASLLTGLYSHQTGMGWMTAADLGTEGYTGQINNQCVTIGEAIKVAGYSTYMVGKWHLTADKNMEPDGPFDSWPLQRGFDKYYGPISGSGSYFTTSYLTYGNERFMAPENYFVTDAISDTASAFIRQHNTESPFFMYVAYTAPHFPLHAKPEDIEKYTGKYLIGWDKLRKQRYEKMLKLEILDSSWSLSLAMNDVKKWEDLSEDKKLEFDRRMAVYAAQIDNMDQGIGRIIDALKETNQFDNTVIFILSDNGGTAERITRGEVETELIGTDDSYESYRKPWATVSNTPFRMFKQWVHEGGISTPLIVHWPDGINEKGIIHNQVGHVIDLMPTCLDLTNSSYPEIYKENNILPFEGMSLVTSFNDNESAERTLFWEHQATRAIIRGKWKLVSDKQLNNPPYIMEWELYNLETDRPETKNIRHRYPELSEELDSLWNAWAKRCNVYPLDGRGWFERLE
jgi:arylsulfatase A-like enzyme